MEPQLKPTHVAFVDSLLGGGTKPSGVYGILSPTGVGKSTLAGMIAANSAVGPSIFSQPLPQSRPWLLLDLHNRLNNAQPRIISHVGRIERKHVASTSDEIQPYEINRSRELPQHNGTPLASSIRMQQTRKILNERLILLADASGGHFDCSKASPAYLQAVIHQVAQSQGGLGGIVIDGARQVWYASKPEGHVSERKFLEGLVSNFCRMIANRYCCPVWITHQIAAAKSCDPPAKLLTHRNAADCKSFADSMDACLVLGTESDLNPESVFSIHCSKGDRSLIKTNRILLKHDPDFSSIVVARGYVLDRRNMSWKLATKRHAVLSKNDRDHIRKIIKSVR